MTPQERLQEVATILSRGVVSLHARSERIPSENRAIPLDFGRETSPHVDTVNETREPENGG
jgi:hypothetical protein